MTPVNRSHPPRNAPALSWAVAIIVSFLALDAYLALSHLRGAGLGALHTVIFVFAFAEGGMFFIAIQIAEQAIQNSSAEVRFWKREVRGAVSALLGVAVFVVVLVGLPRLLLG